MTFLHEAKKPLLAWESHKRISLHDRSATIDGGGNRMSSAHGIMSIHTRRDTPNGHSVLLARAEMQSETDLITVWTVPDNRNAGCFDAIEDAWFAMLESAIPHMTPTEAGLTSRLVERARKAYDAAPGIIFRSDVHLVNNAWHQTIAELPHGMSLRRMAFVGKPTGPSCMPALHGPDNTILARIEINDDGTYSIGSRRGHSHAANVPRGRFEDENEALFALAICQRNCGSDLSGHETMDIMEALQVPLAEQGPFMNRFGFSPLIDPVFSVATA